LWWLRGKRPIATGTTVDSGGYEFIWGGGTATGTTVESGGLQWVGGTANTATIDSGGTQDVVTGGSASDTLLSGGTEVVESGGTISGIVTFASSGTLALDQGSVFSNAMLSGFTASTDILDLTYISFGASPTIGWSQTTPSGGMLSVSDGTHSVNIALLGQYMASSFTATADGGGGTDISDPPIAAAQQLPLAPPQHA
jgi:autotransporter passenger strand-loop-strand repeat protein